MIDTGATQTCVDIEAARRAGLPTIGTARMSSTTHAGQEVPVFVGKLVIEGSSMEITMHRALGAVLSPISTNVVALIGRDLLASTVLVYNGTEGLVSLSV